MTENDSLSDSPFILERKVISRPGAGIRVTQLKMSQAWHDRMARAAEQGREDARKRTFRYQLKQFLSDLFGRTPEHPTGG